MAEYKALVYFMTDEEGGKAGPSHWDLRVPMKIGGEFLDCRITTPEREYYLPGREYRVDIDFLSPDLAREAIAEHKEFELWDLRIFARGKILENE